MDAGYSEGQLDPTEYRARTAKAMEAKTLGELAGLVADLQVPEHLVDTPRASPPPSPPRRPVLGTAVALAAIVVAVVAVCGTVIYTNRGGDTVSEAVAAPDVAPVAPVAPGEPEPVVIEPLDPASPEGIRDFLRRYKEKFGDLQVDEVTFYPTYVFVTRMLDDQPHRAQDWSFRGGFSPSRAPDDRELDTVTVDLAALDVEGLAEVIATGPGRVGLLPAGVGHIFVRADSEGDPLVSVVFEDREGRHGSVDAHMDGTVLDVFPVGGQ